MPDELTLGAAQIAQLDDVQIGKLAEAIVVNLPRQDARQLLIILLKLYRSDAQRIEHAEAIPDDVYWARGLLGDPGRWAAFDTHQNDVTLRSLCARLTWRDAVDVSRTSLRRWARVDRERFAEFPHLLLHND